MKFLIALVLSVCALQALALPTFEDPNAPEHIPESVKALSEEKIRAASEQAEAFRAEINSWFIRFQNFYDRSNAAMRNYRLAHVDLVTLVYNQMMTVFGDHIESIRQSAYGLLDFIAERESNACLEAVLDDHTQNSIRVSATVQSCAEYANRTLAGLLTNVFYPTFADIQSQISTVPVAVIDVLSRGNVLQDEEAIIEFLRARYEVIDLQWISAVSQLLRWESNRFEVDGLFMVDQQGICMTDAVLNYVTTNAQLEARAQAC